MAAADRRRLSIGTGVPTLKPVRDDVLGIWATLKELNTEAEKTAEQFCRDKSNLDDEGRYYRFNVDHGLGDIGLEESKKKEIVAATGRYVASQAVFKQMKACANNLDSSTPKQLGSMSLRILAGREAEEAVGIMGAAFTENKGFILG